MKYNAVLFDFGGTLNGPGEKTWVTRMLRNLFEAGYRVGIVSNSNRYGDARWLRERACKNGWSGYLECIFGSGGMFSRQAAADLGCHKPDPRIYQRALQCLGLEDYPEQVLFVGDDLKADVVGPRIMGMDGLQVDAACDYSPTLWHRLSDSPQKRFNILTEYSLTDSDETTEIVTHLKHLTEPLEEDQEIIVGFVCYKVVSWDFPHTKEDILDTTKNHRQLIRIKASLSSIIN